LDLVFISGHFSPEVIISRSRQVGFFRSVSQTIHTGLAPMSSLYVTVGKPGQSRSAKFGEKEEKRKAKMSL
jgi:hypothetical protein